MDKTTRIQQTPRRVNNTAQGSAARAPRSSGAPRRENGGTDALPPPRDGSVQREAPQAQQELPAGGDGAAAAVTWKGNRRWAAALPPPARRRGSRSWSFPPCRAAGRPRSGRLSAERGAAPGGAGSGHVGPACRAGRAGRGGAAPSAAAPFAAARPPPSTRSPAAMRSMRERGCGRHRAPRERRGGRWWSCPPGAGGTGGAAGVLCVLIPVRESRSWWGSPLPAAGAVLSSVHLDVTVLPKTKEILLSSQP